MSLGPSIISHPTLWVGRRHQLIVVYYITGVNISLLGWWSFLYQIHLPARRTRTIIKRQIFMHFKSFYLMFLGDQVDFESDIEAAWTCWKDLFFTAVDSIIPKKLKYWFTPDTFQLIRVKHQLYRKMKRSNSETNRCEHKAISNLVRSKTWQDTMDYISSLCNSHSAKAGIL